MVFIICAENLLQHYLFKILSKIVVKKLEIMFMEDTQSRVEKYT